MADGIVRQKYGRWKPVPKEIEDQVIAFYLEGNSALQCSKKYGVSANDILKRKGIKLRSKSIYQQKVDPSIHLEICRLYQKGMSTPKIEKIFNLGRTRIYEILEQNGIKRRTGRDYRPQSAGREHEIIALYQTGVSAANTGKNFGVCEATVLYVLRKFNVKVRRVGISDVTKIYNWKGGVSKDIEYQKNRKNKYRNDRRKRDPLFKLINTLRGRVNTLFRRQRIQWKKNRRTCELLGADWQTVFAHLESQFVDGMNWKNHGHNGWHIDHKIPLASAKTKEEVEKLFHYTNLQPLWAKDNHKKGAK